MVFSHSRKFRAWVSKKRVRIVTATLVGLAAVPFVVMGVTRALTDMTPPVVTSFAASTEQVNLDTASVPVTFSGTATDNLSGFGSLKMYYTSPSGHQVVEAEMTSSTPTSFEAQVTFPYHAEAGVWAPTVTVSDLSGNAETYTSSQLSGMGYDLGITATSTTPDTAAPVVTNMEQIYGPDLDLTASSQNYLFFVTVTDENSGVANVNGRIVSPSGKQYVGGDCATTGQPDLYACEAPTGMYLESGTWQFQLSATDVAGNTRVYDPSDFTALNFPHTLNITSTDDTAPVTLESLQFTPFYIHHEDANPGGVVVVAHGVFSDLLAGVQDATLTYRSQASTQMFSTSGYVNNLGGEADRQYEYWIITPPYPAEGDWLPELSTMDGVGNTKVYSNSDLQALGINLKFTIGQGVVTLAAAGNTLTTDTNQTGATEQNPVQAAITTPIPGTVSITPVQTTAPAQGFGGYDVIGNQYTIVAPSTTADSPLVLRFTLDASQMVGLSASDIIIFRDGAPVEKCLGSPVAIPDPCETTYSTDENGDATVTVLSSHASRWVVGAADETAPLFTFQGFKKLDAAPKLNKDQAGSTIPVKFNLGSDYGTEILANGSPSSRKVSCSTLEPKTDELAAVSANKQDLKVNDNGYYRYDWKTLKSWSGTCREFMLKFTTGETASVYFKF